MVLEALVRVETAAGHLIITQVFAWESLTTDHNLPFPGSPSTSCLPHIRTFPFLQPYFNCQPEPEFSCAPRRHY